MMKGDPHTLPRPGKPAALFLRMLGPVEVTSRGRSVNGFESQKALAVLCYLALERGAVSRSRLCWLFWGEKTEDRARGNLRRVLHNLSECLPGLLDAGRHAVSLVEGRRLWIDVLELDRLADKGDVASLRSATELHRGDFLEGFYFGDAPELEDWLARQREYWRERFAEVLRRRVEAMRFAGEADGDSAITLARRLVQLDPWREDAHRQLMLLLARNARFADALRQFDRCREALAEELGAEPAGDTLLLRERIRSAAIMPARKLPAPPLRFFGRTRELAAIRDGLADPACRLVTLVGPGGIGKTRLALRAAEQLRNGFLHGVGLVSLGGFASPVRLAGSIAAALGIPLRPGAETTRQVVEYLREKEMLLVLDGGESLDGGSELVAEITESAPSVKLLIASRVLPELRAQRAIDVEGLELADGPTPAPHGSSAVQLFVDRARLSRAGFAPTEQDLDHIARLCRLVGGMPLAIELSAALVRSHACKEIVRRVEADIETLDGEWADLPPRHRSLKSLFDESWQTLAPSDRSAMMALAPFCGPVSAEAAAVVAEATAATLDTLVRHSLLRHDGAGRYTLHAHVRHYATRMLRQSGAESLVAERHGRYFLDHLGRLEKDLFGASHRAALERIEADIDDIRAAWSWALASGEEVLLGRCLDALFGFFRIRCRFREGAELLAETLHPARGVAPRCERLRARISGRIAALTLVRGSYEEAESALSQALALARDHSDSREVAFCLAELGQVRAIGCAQFEEAWPMWEEAADRLRRLGDGFQLAFVLNRIGFARLAVGDYHGGRGALEEARRLEPRSAYNLATTFEVLGLCAHGLGEYARAVASYEEALRAQAELDDRIGMSSLLAHLGNALTEQGRFADARCRLEESLAQARSIGRRGTFIPLYYLGMLAEAEGDAPRALAIAEEALGLSSKNPTGFAHFLALDLCGHALCASGETVRAEERFREARPIAMVMGAAQYYLDIAVGMAACRRARGDSREALKIAAAVLHHPDLQARTRRRVERTIEGLRCDLSKAHVERALKCAAGRSSTIQADIVAFLDEAFA